MTSPIAPSEMAQITLYPALSLVKLGSMFREQVVSKVDEKMMIAEAKAIDDREWAPLQKES